MPFGRRASTSQPAQNRIPREGKSGAARVLPSPVTPELRAAILEIDRSADEAVARDIEHWKALRKAKKRSFKEPWRSFAIASSVVFGLSMWLLPDSVATIVEWLTTGLTVVSIAQGFRKR